MPFRKRARLAYMLVLRNRVQDRAAASGAQPRKAGVIEDDDTWFKIWACQSIIAMANIALNAEDPDGLIKEWFDEAGAGDEEHLLWGMAMWKTMRTMNSFELERARHNALTRAHQLRASSRDAD